MSRSRLVNSGGTLLVDDLISSSWFSALRDEGLQRRELANEQEKIEPDLSSWRSGNPNRHLASAESGPILELIYSDYSLISKLEGMSTSKLKPTGDRGSYSYYDHPGHFLGLHRDIKTCDLTLITCLDRKEGDCESGALRLYPKAIRSELSSIGPDTPCRELTMRKGQSLLLLGGCIPHEVLPAARGFSRSIAVLCYQIY